MDASNIAKILPHLEPAKPERDRKAAKPLSISLRRTVKEKQDSPKSNTGTKQTGYPENRGSRGRKEEQKEEEPRERTAKMTPRAVRGLGANQLTSIKM